MNRLFDFLKLLNKITISNNKNKEPNFKIPEKALIVMPNFIGDAILLTPIIRNLRLNFGRNCVIDVICRNNIAQLLCTLPYIDKFHLKEDFENQKIQFLRKQNYDTIFIINHSPFWSIAAYKEKIKQRVALNLKRIGVDNKPFLATHTINSTELFDDKHQLEVNMNILKDLNLSIFNKHLEIRLTDNDIQKAKSLLINIDKPNVLINITCGSPGKCWSADKWIDIIKYLDNKGYNLVVAGVKDDKDKYYKLEQQSGVKLINLCGQTNVRETIALYRQMNLIITTDSGPAHMAGIAKTPNIVVIYGPTNMKQWKPIAPFSNLKQIALNLKCRPCITRSCLHKKCLNDLDSQLVIDAIEKMEILKPNKLKMK